MSEPTRDEIKQAAERIIRWAEEKMTIEWDGLIVARAYLALREQVDTVALPALKHYADDSLYFPRSIIRECQAKGVRLAPIYSDFGEPAQAAIKTIEEEQG